MATQSVARHNQLAAIRMGQPLHHVRNGSLLVGPWGFEFFELDGFLPEAVKNESTWCL
jgi:hypothetical protein